VGIIPRNVGEASYCVRHPASHRNPLTAHPERRSAPPENSTGRERLVRQSRNTAGRDLNVTSLQSGAAAHPLTVTLESAWSAKLSECLMCLRVLRSPCHLDHGALPSSMLPLAGFIVVNRKFLERMLAGLGHHWQLMILAGVAATNIAAVTH
jgi:hypothetical protein